MAQKFSKQTVFTALLAVLVAVCVALGVSFLIPDTQISYAEDTDASHTTALSEGGTLTGGSYYLGSDVTGDITISSGATVTLCLHGHTLTGTGSDSVITVESGASLVLCDCEGDGVITGGNAATSSGGGVAVAGGASFTMTGGTITGNSAASGGGVTVGGNASFTMTGGTITGNEAVRGGGVYVASSGEFTMTGGSVSGTANTDSEGNGGFGDSVYVGGAFYMAGGSLDGSVADFGTLSVTDGILDRAAYSSVSDYIAEGGVVAKSGNYFIVHSHDSAITAAGGTLTSGSYYLGSDVTGDITISSGATVTLCLNGFTLTGTGNGSVITVESGASLVLCDCEGDGVITGGSGTLNIEGEFTNGGGIYNRGVFTMTGGTISGNTVTGSGGGVQNNGTFIMIGGTISDNSAASGGGVAVVGTFNMSGGSISDNEAVRGGGVYVASIGAASVTGGRISGNTVSTDSTGGGLGASVYNAEGGTFNMTGGTLSGTIYGADGIFASNTAHYILWGCIVVIIVIGVLLACAIVAGVRKRRA